MSTHQSCWLRSSQTGPSPSSAPASRKSATSEPATTFLVIDPPSLLRARALPFEDHRQSAEGAGIVPRGPADDAKLGVWERRAKVDGTSCPFDPAAFNLGSGGRPMKITDIRCHVLLDPGIVLDATSSAQD